MRAWLLAVCWLVSTASVLAQSSQDPAKSASEPLAFEIRIDASAEVQALLERHLELYRYQQIADLSPQEMERLMQAAQGNVRELLATQGYFNPSINITLASTKDIRTVELKVQSGEPVRVSAVKLNFAGPIATDTASAKQRRTIVESWGLPAGQRFTQAAWDDAKQKALRQLTSQRYPTGEIAHSRADIDPISHSAVLELTLQSGELFKWGWLAINGLQRYDDILVRRLARLPSGQAYDLETLVAAQRRLTDSGFFDSANIRLDTNSTPQSAVTELTLREAKVQKLVLGVGASSDNGARLSAEHTHMQLPWLGWQANTKLSVDRLIKSFNANLVAQPDDDGWRWNTAAQLKNDDSSSYQVISQRLQAGSTQKTDNFDRSYYLQYDRADTAPTDLRLPTTALALSVNYAFTLRRFDRLPFPSGGWGLGAEIGGGSTLGAQRSPFTRVLGHWHGIMTLSAQDDDTRSLALASRLALRGQLGAVVAKESAPLPVTELFLAGGSNSVRGYALNSIGVALSDGTVSAGRYLATGSLEWQKPLLRGGQPSDWESAVFIDMGSVANTYKQLETKTGVGAGLRWKTPIGPLQIDLAYGLALRRYRLHLNLGFTF